MTPEQMYNEMVEIYGDKLPNLDQQPREFEYYVKLYKYRKFMEQQNVQEQTTNGM